MITEINNDVIKRFKSGEIIIYQGLNQTPDFVTFDKSYNELCIGRPGDGYEFTNIKNINDVTKKLNTLLSVGTLTWDTTHKIYDSIIEQLQSGKILNLHGLGYDGKYIMFEHVAGQGDVFVLYNNAGSIEASYQSSLALKAKINELADEVTISWKK